MTAINVGDRVAFNARSFGPDDPYEGAMTRMAGTVTRPVWGRAADPAMRNVSIRTDEGHFYVRLVCTVTPEGDHHE